MKAIEIDWSKAPEGATHYLPENDEHGWIACWFKQDGNVWMAKAIERDGEKWSEDDDMDEAVKFLIPRPSTWNGTGLPPVGTVCEGRGRLDGEWREVVVLAHRIGRAVVSFTDHERLQWCEADEIRPIRTAEQIAAEEREKAIEQMIDDYKYKEGQCTHHLMRSQAERIYDAGYRKVEGDKQ